MSFGYCITSSLPQRTMAPMGPSSLEFFSRFVPRSMLPLKILTILLGVTRVLIGEQLTISPGRVRCVHARFSQQFRFSWVAIGTSGIVINPWSSWWTDDGTESAMNPEWWVSHNNVKHHRLDSYAEANLWNVLQALSGLFILLSCLYRYEYEHNAEEAPRYLPAPQRLAFSSRGIEIGSSESTYVVGTSLCVSPGFHVDKPLRLTFSDEGDIRVDSEQGVSSIQVND